MGLFSYKRVPQRVFYSAVEGIKSDNGNIDFMATAAKALCDYVYIHRRDWFSFDDAIASLRLDTEGLTATLESSPR